MEIFVFFNKFKGLINFRVDQKADRLHKTRRLDLTLSFQFVCYNPFWLDWCIPLHANKQTRQKNWQPVSFHRIL